MSFQQYTTAPPAPQASASGSNGRAPRYRPSAALAAAVNTALAVDRPLLVTGEPGTGKTTLASSIAQQLVLPLAPIFTCRSEQRWKDVLYEFDSLRRFYDAQVKDARAVRATEYRTLRALGAAIASQEREVVLIDEVDKAPRDFPNDLLTVLETMSFEVEETGETFRSTKRPVVVITSNSERQLPEPFLRRCVYHHIEFPDKAQLEQIVAEHLGPAGEQLDSLTRIAVSRFNQLRARGLEKPPATAELLDWIKVLVAASGGDIAGTAARLETSSLAELEGRSVLVKLKVDLERLRS